MVAETIQAGLDMRLRKVLWEYLVFSRPNFCMSVYYLLLKLYR